MGLRRALLAFLLVLAAVASPAVVHARGAAEVATVAYVVDGDTLELTSGARVRLLQIDTPELGRGECYSRAAARELRRLVPEGTRVALQSDPRLDGSDRYGRLLHYVLARGRNVNLELVRRGAATVWFYGGVRGRYADALLAAARRARAERLGLWGACRTVWNPYRPAETSARTRPQRQACDASYPDVCIPSPPPDLDCRDVPHRDFRVVGADPHRFDGNADGRGCE